MTVSGHGGTSSHFGKIEANTRCGCERAVESGDLTAEEWVARRASAGDRAIVVGGTVLRGEPAGARPLASRSTWELGPGWGRAPEPDRVSLERR